MPVSSKQIDEILSKIFPDNAVEYIPPKYETDKQIAFIPFLEHPRSTTLED